MKIFEKINSATFVSVLGQCSSRISGCFVATHSWSGYLNAGTLMPRTAWGARAWKPSPGQHCQVEQGLMPGSALTLPHLWQRGKVPNSSSASGCKAPPGTVPTSSHRRWAEAAPTVPAPSGSDPAPQRALSEHPSLLLFTGHLLLVLSMVHSQMSLQIFCTKYSLQYISVCVLLGFF